MGGPAAARAEGASWLEGPVEALPGVGPRLAPRLHRLGLRRAADLLLHRPLRYEDRTRLRPLGGLVPGEEALVQGTVAAARPAGGRGRRGLRVLLEDEGGALLLRFFHASPRLERALRPGTRLQCFGEVRPAGPGELPGPDRAPAMMPEMVHPELRFLRPGEEARPEAALTPVYPATEGLPQPLLRRLVLGALERLEGEGWAGASLLPAPLAAELEGRLGLPPAAEALRLLHRPPPGTDTAALLEGRHPALRRLALEELLAHHLSLRRLRAGVRRHRAPVLAGEGRLLGAFLESLPFRLTGAQRRVLAEIEADLASGRPMLRLVQGDVGSGKTVVAAAAALRAVEGGGQAAFMAPTELLAEQHLRNLRRWLEPLGVGVAALTGRSGAAERRRALAGLADGSLGVAVGTHALFQEAVRFHRLALVVIDEQHRFGVAQRLALWAKGAREGLHPHQLVMTATPIPRTLALTAYADLDCSVIDELPPGRTPVETVVVPDARRAEVVERIRRACRAGRQAYWVCPLIEESETLEAQAAEETARRLREALPELRVGLVHGRLRAEEKEAVMEAFRCGALDLLVATTVIEVGVDVPRASLMVIDNAERLGLAQLHQLRGRVGRGAERSACVLLYHPPLSPTARERLAVMRATTDGFEVARRDLELRGPGELLGTRQSGLVQLKAADLRRDGDLLPRVAEAAARLEREAPGAVEPLLRRWLGEGLGWARAG
ncbi:MAG: ATP-dependent DNA helicase RecG [Gammaproteobacteria bacterium]|nr:MAG: ATP-dependent DNA helicase RecG [Gammaproteobacteria bacterium]